MRLALQPSLVPSSPAERKIILLQLWTPLASMHPLPLKPPERLSCYRNLIELHPYKQKKSHRWHSQTRRNIHTRIESRRMVVSFIDIAPQRSKKGLAFFLSLNSVYAWNMVEGIWITLLRTMARSDLFFYAALPGFSSVSSCHTT